MPFRGGGPKTAVHKFNAHTSSRRMASASLSYELFPRSVLTSSSLRRISSSDGDAVLIGSLDDIQRELKTKQGVAWSGDSRGGAAPFQPDCQKIKKLWSPRRFAACCNEDTRSDRVAMHTTTHK